MQTQESQRGIAKWDKTGLYVRIAESALLAMYQPNAARVGRIVFESNTSADLFIKYPHSQGTYHDPADLEIITEEAYNAALLTENAAHIPMNRQAVISTGILDGKPTIEIQRGGDPIRSHVCANMSIHSVVRLNQFMKHHDYVKTSLNRDTPPRYVAVLLFERGA